MFQAPLASTLDTPPAFFHLLMCLNLETFFFHVQIESELKNREVMRERFREKEREREEEEKRKRELEEKQKRERLIKDQEREKADKDSFQIIKHFLVSILSNNLSLSVRNEIVF